MYSNIVKDLYIGKSKLTFRANDTDIPDIMTIGKLFYLVNPNTEQGRNLPDYGTIGNFWTDDNNQGIFEITFLHPDRKIYVTGIPKGEVLDNFRLEGTIWSSYYEDDYRGYLFQIIPAYIKLKLIIDGSN